MLKGPSKDSLDCFRQHWILLEVYNLDSCYDKWENISECDWQLESCGIRRGPKKKIKFLGLHKRYGTESPAIPSHFWAADNTGQHDFDRRIWWFQVNIFNFETSNLYKFIVLKFLVMDHFKMGCGDLKWNSIKSISLKDEQFNCRLSTLISKSSNSNNFYSQFVVHVWNWPFSWLLLVYSWEVASHFSGNVAVLSKKNGIAEISL